MVGRKERARRNHAHVLLLLILRLAQVEEEEEDPWDEMLIFHKVSQTAIFLARKWGLKIYGRGRLIATGRLRRVKVAVSRCVVHPETAGLCS